MRSKKPPLIFVTFFLVSKAMAQWDGPYFQRRSFSPSANGWFGADPDYIDKQYSGNDVAYKRTMYQLDLSHPHKQPDVVYKRFPTIFELSGRESPKKFWTRRKKRGFQQKRFMGPR